jgi:hypothetical protein
VRVTTGVLGVVVAVAVAVVVAMAVGVVVAVAMAVAVVVGVAVCAKPGASAGGNVASNTLAKRTNAMRFIKPPWARERTLFSLSAKSNVAEPAVVTGWQAQPD